MEIRTRFEQPSKVGQAIIPGLPILPHGVERHVVPGAVSYTHLTLPTILLV